MAEKNEKINNLVSVSMQNLEGIADVDSVICKPLVTASGYQIIPFSKITIGNLTGWGEYGDVKVIKQILGINGNYTERKGDVYSDKFNPKRDKSVLTLKPKEMDNRAKEIFNQLIKEMQELGRLSAKYSKK